jgi:DNA replication protein DnaC
MKTEIYQQENGENELFKKALGRFELDEKYTLNDIFGSRYMSKFDDHKVSEKHKVDKKLSEMFFNNSGFIISGGVGVGKTMSLIYIYRQIIDHLSRESRDTQDVFLCDFSRYSKRIQVYFAPQLFSIFHNAEKANIPDFIIIDDIGREYAEPFALSQFEVFIEDIYKKKDTSLIITTNLSLSQFRDREGWARINDRLMEICSWLEIKGESRRHK